MNEITALNYSAVWAAVNVIASAVASLPLILYRRLPDGGKERYTGHPLYRLLHDEPNSEMTSLVFRETLQAHVLTWGNGYAEIERDGSGRPVALWPLDPSRVQPIREGGRLHYRFTNENGTQVILASRDVLHVPGLSFDGLCGYSPIAKARESIGLGLATERFGSAFFGQGSTFGGVLTSPHKLTQLQKDDIREAIDKHHKGVDRANKFLVLSDGFKFDRLGIPPDDAQFLETRKFQITEVARWFNLPPHKLKDLDRATFSNIEHSSIEFVSDTLRPWLVRWEQEINRKLIAPLERTQQFAEHLVDGLLRGDITSRYAAYAVGTQHGWLSANDIRGFENLNPIDGGNTYLVPVNMIPIDRMDEYADRLVALPRRADGTPTPLEDIGDSTDENKEARALVTAATEARQQAESQLLEARDARSALEAQLSDARQSDTDRAAAFLAAERALITETMRRMVDRETERIRRAGTSPEKIRAILSEDGFYNGHTALMERALCDTVRMHLAWTRSDADPSTVTASYVESHIAESRAQLQAILDGEADDIAPSIGALLERWERDRPTTLADQLMTEGIEYVRAA